MALFEKGGKSEGILLGAFMGVFLFGLVLPLVLGLFFLLLNGSTSPVLELPGIFCSVRVIFNMLMVAASFQH